MNQKTLKDIVINYLVDNYMPSGDAVTVFEAVKNAEGNESLIDRWDDFADGYPDTLKSGIIYSARIHALEWIDKNLPKAFFRVLFAE